MCLGSSWTEQDLKIFSCRDGDLSRHPWTPLCLGHVNTQCHSLRLLSSPELHVLSLRINLTTSTNVDS